MGKLLEIIGIVLSPILYVTARAIVALEGKKSLRNELEEKQRERNLWG